MSGNEECGLIEAAQPRHERKRGASSDPLDSDQGKSRRGLAANVDRHRELRPPCSPHLGTPAGHHLGTPRPMRSRVTTTGGRFPGSRVVTFDHLPRETVPSGFYGRRLAAYSCGGSCGIAYPSLLPEYAHRIPLVIPLRGTTIGMLASGSGRVKKCRCRRTWKAS